MQDSAESMATLFDSSWNGFFCRSYQNSIRFGIIPFVTIHFYFRLILFETMKYDHQHAIHIWVFVALRRLSQWCVDGAPYCVHAPYQTFSCINKRTFRGAATTLFHLHPNLRNFCTTCPYKVYCLLLKRLSSKWYGLFEHNIVDNYENGRNRHGLTSFRREKNLCANSNNS